MNTAHTQPREKQQKDTSFSDFIVGLMLVLLVFPVFIIFHKLIPPLNWPYYIDRVLLLVGVYSLLKLLLHVVRQAIVVIFIIAVCWLGFGSLWGSYGFKSFYADYRALLFSMAISPNPEKDVFVELASLPVKNKTRAACDYDNPEVRNFAVKVSGNYFSQYQNEEYYNKYRTIIQCFSVFKEINGNWRYVSDPEGREYYAKASESLKHFSGDCDDHTVFMVSCMKAIGGKPRMILTTGHIYPELHIGDKVDLETINYLIKKVFFEKESKNKTVNYHEDGDGSVWLNLDYTARYPGGQFMDEKVLGVIPLD